MQEEQNIINNTITNRSASLYRDGGAGLILVAVQDQQVVQSPKHGSTIALL